MKRFILSMTMLLTVALSSMAMSYEQARDRALFLTDKMAYELNLNDEQYEAAYEVNLDYLMSINTYDDLYGTYWTRRNLDLSYILFDWQYDAFCAAAYFYRPLTWTNGYWHFGIYTRYPVRTYFYFGRPAFYNTYCGGHSWRMNNGRSWYHGRTFGPRPGESRFGMRDRFDRGDFRGPGHDNRPGFDRPGNGRPGNNGRHDGGRFDRNDRPGNGNNGGFNRGDDNRGNNGGNNGGGFNRGNGGNFNYGNGNVYRNGSGSGSGNKGNNSGNGGFTRKDNNLNKSDDIYRGSTSQVNNRRPGTTTSGGTVKNDNGSSFGRRPQITPDNGGIVRRESSTRVSRQDMTTRPSMNTNVAPQRSFSPSDRGSSRSNVSSSGTRPSSTFTPSRSFGGGGGSQGGSSRGGGGGHFGGRR